MTTEELRDRLSSIRSTSSVKERKELGSGTRREVLRLMRDNIGVLASAIYVWQMKTNCNAMGVGIGISIWDLRKTSRGRETDGDGYRRGVEVRRTAKSCCSAGGCESAGQEVTFGMCWR